MRFVGWFAGIASVLLAGFCLLGERSVLRVSAASEVDPNAACAGCHRAIYERYRTTPMARASGSAAEGFMAASFRHAASGVSYRILREGGQPGGKVYLTFARAGTGTGSGSGTGAGASDEGLEGKRELEYFVGSGKRGRTYLFEQEGYWFEIPINWYAKKRVWDMAPNYLTAERMPLTLPVDPSCLRCHASEAADSLPEARNKYAGAPFAHGGITCSACHGDAAQHVRSGGKVGLMKLGSLEPVKRDSACLNCHLEGQSVVVHQGKRLVDFRPGESIFDYASFYTWSGAAGSGARATSQWEALLKSGCKRGAGAKLTCTSCHDPHGSTEGLSEGQRVAYYRARCLDCHGADRRVGVGGESFATSHHPEKQDCAECHMPRAASSDIAHEQVTDHQIPRIPRIPARAAAEVEGAGRLEAIGTGADGADDTGSGRGSGRDLGLAYAMAAARGDRESAQEARRLLEEAEKSPGAASDGELHAQLGFLKQAGGEPDGARREYGLALAVNSHDSFAGGNLGLLDAGDRKYEAAVGLWTRAFADNPVELKTGMNLATVECGLGRREAALGTLSRILEFSPDDGPARKMTQEIRSGEHSCSARQRGGR